MCRAIFLLLSFFSFVLLRAQDINGYYQSHYSGIVGASYNPALLADNRYSLDILLIGLGVEAGNNYAGTRRSMLLKPDFSTEDLLLRNTRTKKSAFVRNTLLLPAMMRSDEKKGWGIDLRIRNYANADGVGPKLAHTLIFELDDPPIYGQSLYERHIGVTTMSWFEIGGTYARVLRSNGENYLAAGIRPKFLWGLSAAYVFVNDANYTFYNDSTLSIDAADVRFAHSDNFTFDPDFQPSWRLRFNPGAGIDAGIVYEHRPGVLQQDKMDRESPWPGLRYRPNYDYCVGVSLLDLGAILFRSGELSGRYGVEANRWDIDDNAFDSTAPPPLSEVFDLRNGGSLQGKRFFMRLPLTLAVDYDRRITPEIYVNAGAFTALYLRGYNGKRVHELTRLSITPRWERRWFGVWTPVTFSRLGNLTLGTGVRIGPLILGTNDILMWLMPEKKFFSADFYVLLKVPLFPAGEHGSRGLIKSSKRRIDECAE